MHWRYGVKVVLWDGKPDGVQIIEVFDDKLPPTERSWCETSLYADDWAGMVEVLDRIKSDMTKLGSQPDVIEDAALKQWWWSDATTKLYPSEEV
jgi:hypothetical protein